MVQMKVIPVPDVLSNFQLYIPHGSDERRLKHLIRNSANVLYIPHGSDESLFLITNCKPVISALYPTWFR